MQVLFPLIALSALASSLQRVPLTLEQVLADAPVVVVVRDDPSFRGRLVVEEIVRDGTGQIAVGQALAPGSADLDVQRSFAIEQAPDGTTEWPVFFVFHVAREGEVVPARRVVFLAPRTREPLLAYAVEGGWADLSDLPRIRGALAAAGTGVLSLVDLAPSSPPSWATTAMLRLRTGPIPESVDHTWGFAVTTTCGEGYCVDGLHDRVQDRWLVPAGLTEGEAPILAADGWLDRRIFPAAGHLDRISVFVGWSEFSGGAHANNDIACRTFDRATGRALTLSDVVGAGRAREILDGVRGEVGDYTVREDGFLVGQGGRIVVCAEAPFPMAGTVWRVEVRVAE